jgi:DNA-binding PadR family transcriptional regulator
MQTYKLNLVLGGGRYGDLEQRLIRRFAKDRALDEFWILSDLEILLSSLLDDGLLEYTKQTRTFGGGIEQRLYRLTEQGKDFVARWPQP